MAKATAITKPAEVTGVTLELTLEEAQIISAVIGATSPGIFSGRPRGSQQHPVDAVYDALKPIVGVKYPGSGDKRNPFKVDRGPTIEHNT